MQLRVKREAQHVLGESGAVLEDGTQVQFTEGGVKPLVEGPSGIIWSNGQVTQKRSKREAQHLVGESGAVLEDGQQVQFTEGGVVPLVEGPAGIIWSNGQLTQKRSKRNAPDPPPTSSPTAPACSCPPEFSWPARDPPAWCSPTARTSSSKCTFYVIKLKDN